MFKIFKENKVLKQQVAILSDKNKRLETYITSLTPVDLTRKSLKLLPLSRDFNPNDEKYSANDYIKLVADLEYNTTLKEEMKKIVAEQVEYIATQSPNEIASMIARGTINGISLLQERMSAAKEFMEYKEKEKKNVEVE